MLIHTGIISVKADELQYFTLYEDVAHWMFYCLESCQIHILYYLSWSESETVV